MRETKTKIKKTKVNNIWKRIQALQELWVVSPQRQGNEDVVLAVTDALLIKC